MRIVKSLVITALLVAISAFPVLAKVGVGVGLGKIQIDEVLAPGGIYNLPSLPVLNTGDESGDYEVEVTYLSEQPELRPDASWFSFTPQSFPLEAGGSQTVAVKLTIPVDARPGKYFAFLEAHPVTKAEGVTIGVAAATKLNFEVRPSGILGAAIERLRSLIEANRILFTVLAVLVLGVVGVYFARQYLDIKIGFKRPKKQEGKEEQQE